MRSRSAGARGSAYAFEGEVVMKNKGTSGRIDSRTARRARDRRGTRSSKAPPLPQFADPSVCESCAAVYSRQTWRRDRPITHALLERAQWVRCPACEQKKSGIAYGRVLATGSLDGRRLAAIERRVHNVAARAEFTQPERTIVSMDRTSDGLEILTTSQKLAHRIATELKKAFGGRATYAWADDDGSLSATWKPR
jgi:hypothetical protein